METLPLSPSRPHSKEALIAFLESCRLRAKERGRSQLVSITLPAGNLDPLAVLESIYEENELHFYVERRDLGIALAGAEAVVQFSPSGPDRFKQSKRFIHETLDNTVAVGDDTLPFFGPHFFCGYTFEETASEGATFPASTIFVPRWQVSLIDQRSIAVANASIGPDEDVAAVGGRIWAASAKFDAFAYGSVSMDDAPASREELRVLETIESGGEKRFGRLVNEAIERIGRHEFEKIVLARELKLRANRPFHPLEILNTLRERFQDCYAFSFGNGRGQSFIGASPERLAMVQDGTLYTEALAGSAPRGARASEDAAIGARLLASEKDLHEQRIVLDSIRRRLEAMDVSPEYEDQPRLKRLQNVQHLQTEVICRNLGRHELLDFVEALHPTPAVGGMPREAAVPVIGQLESFERGLYAGALGWVNSKAEGEFVVGIRSAEVDGDRARLFAGVGVVERSVAEKEIQETNLKFAALMKNLV